MYGCVVPLAVAELVAELGEATVEDMALEAIIPEAVGGFPCGPCDAIVADNHALALAQTTCRRGKDKAPTVAEQRPPSLSPPLRFGTWLSFS